ncbi:hypothetical protein IV203_030124 [Nitzschia inconspicua]|uniref:Uncharacterized protein n=1 Tax=Nitzschia inconspicua TaxID=303405 RepID=A0A9K3Q1E1_9STRA|nr:hypothetical protein IV203_030124 [Nitzschia inconspicua]
MTDFENEAGSQRRSLQSQTTMDLVGMPRVTESPYQSGVHLQSAEIDERLFDQVKDLIVPYHGLSRRQMRASSAAQRMFGSVLAQRIADSYYQIDVSGVTYGSGWVDGIIQEKNCGVIPKHLLLLCLQEHRFAAADKSVNPWFLTIVKELDLWKDFVTAMKSWKLTKKYPRAANCTGPSSFQPTRKVACLKCIIFLCRAWHAAKLMNQTKLEESLVTKIEDCLNILDSSVKATMSSESPVSLHQSCQSNNSTKKSQPSKTEIVREVSNNMDPTERTLFSSSIPRTTTPSKPLPASADSQAVSPTDFGGNSAQIQRYNDRIAKQTELSTNEEKNYWYTMDPTEVTLNPTEIEMAWLLEETTYCLRRRDISWDFVTHFASPTLQTQLSRIAKAGRGLQEEAAENEKKLSALVRLNLPIVKRRFAAVRRDIRKRLLLQEVRPAMRRIIPVLRRETNPMVLKQREEQGDIYEYNQSF